MDASGSQDFVAHRRLVLTAIDHENLEIATSLCSQAVEQVSDVLRPPVRAYDDRHEHYDLLAR
jgi:hypothetical protein